MNPLKSAIIQNSRYGVKDRCLQFASENHVNLGIHGIGSLVDGAENITVEVWFYPTALADQNWIFTVPINNSFIGFLLRVHSTNFIEFTMRAAAGTSSLICTGTTTITTNQWYHFVGVARIKDKSMSVYINGVEDGSRSASFTVDEYTTDTPTTSEELIAHSRSGRACVGLIDEVRVWKVNRTAEQIKRYMNTRLYGTETGLVAYYRMDEGSGSIAYDNSQNSNDGTITGATWVKP